MQRTFFRVIEFQGLEVYAHIGIGNECPISFTGFHYGDSSKMVTATGSDSFVTVIGSRTAIGSMIVTASTTATIIHPTISV
jgi:hypothetical protein